ncbi:MAG: DnaD domain protein [Clostridium butyricum]|nr:DnaD domain protein [Clostridium butyricum]
MGEGKWIKTYVNTYDDTPSKMIDAHENRDAIHYIRGRLLALAGKVNRNGELYMTETKPYTIRTLAIEFNRDFEVVKEAIKVLKSLDVIEITENRTFKISDWEIDQNVEGLERIRKQTNERVARHRAAKKATEDNKFESNASCDNQELNNIEEKINEKDIILEDNIINNIDSKCNVAVTKENKKRGKKRSKKKENNSLIDFSCDNNEFEINDDNSNVFCDSFVSHDYGFTDSAFDDDMSNDSSIIKSFDICEKDGTKDMVVSSFDVSEDVEGLLKYCKNKTGNVSNITAASLKIAIDTYTEKYVKMAIDKSIEVDKFNMAYINGILKNWKREGYPRKDESDGGNINGANSYGKSTISDTIKFEGFKPKKPRELDEEERRYAEKNLI